MSNGTPRAPRALLIGANLKRYRKQASLSQLEAERATGFLREHISAYENGRREPNQEKLERFAEVYGCVWTDFFRAIEPVAA